MKNFRKVFITSLFMILAVTASAQLKFGVKAGLNTSGVTGSELDYKAGFSAGLMAQVNVPVIGIGFETGLYYATLGAQKAKISANPSYLQVPLLLTYRFGLGSLLSIYPSAGVYLGYGIGGKSDFGDLGDYGDLGELGGLVDLDIPSGKVDYFGDDVNKFDAGLSVGINLQVTKFVIGLGYERGFAKINKESVDGIDNSYNSNVKVSVGYFF